MSDEQDAKKAPREWWVNHYPEHYPHWHMHSDELEADDGLNGHKHERFHVIEKSAYDELQHRLAICQDILLRIVNDVDLQYEDVNGLLDEARKVLHTETKANIWDPLGTLKKIIKK